jgi:hypothetical protein
VTRWRRPGANEVLLVYLLLAAIGLTCGWLSRGFGTQYPLTSLLVAAFLTWRVSRGGRVSRMILIMGSVAFCAAAVLAVATMWDLTVMVMVISGVAQVALLVSPPVYGRTRRPVPVAARARGWAQLLRRPPAWLLPWGLLGGVLLTLACLGHMDWVTVQGCGPAPCNALAEGYPLYWLTAVHNEPVISKAALLKDCTQWALACTSVLYLAWLGLTPPGGLADAPASPAPRGGL